MKKANKTVSILIILCMTLSLFSAAVSADSGDGVIFSTKFDSKDDWTSAMSNRWNTVSDETSPLYGNVMASSKDVNDSKQYVTFDSPITSGKFVVSADIKQLSDDALVKIGIVNATGDGISQNGDSSAYAKHLITLTGGKLGVGIDLKAQADKFGITVDSGKWYHVDVVADFGDKSLTYYINGENKYTFTNGLDGVDAAYSLFLRSTCKTAGTATSYIDNVSVVAGIGDVSYVSSVGSGYADIEFSRAMNGIDNGSAVVKPVLGGDEIPVTAVETMGMKLMRVHFDTSRLIGGTEYMISADEPYSGVTGGELNAVTFNTPAGAAKNYILPVQDFNDFDGTLSEPWSVVGDKNENISAVDIPDGSRALRIDRSDTDTRAAVTFDGVDTSSTDVTVEFKYYLNKAGKEQPFLRVFVDYDKVNTTPFEAQGGTLFTYSSTTAAGQGGASIIKGKSNGEWYTVKMIIHNNSTVDYYVYDISGNETAVTGKVMNVCDKIGSNKLTGLKFVHRAAGADSANFDGSVYVDDVSVYTTTTPVTINSIRFKDVDGNVHVPQTSGVTPDVKAVSVTFADEMAADTIDVSLTKNSSEISGIGTYSEELKTYTFTLDKCLEPDSVYTLVIGGAQSADGKTLGSSVEYTFETKSGALRVLEFSITDSSGNAISLADITADTELNLNAKVVNTSGIAQDVSLSYDVYNGMFLSDIDEVHDTLSGANTYFEQTITFRCSDISNLSVKGFLWDNARSIYPLADCIELR